MARKKKIGVWVLSITHRYGVNITVHRTLDGANTALYTYCDSEWDSDYDTEESPKPREHDKLVCAYFDNTGGDEYYTIESAELED